MNSSQSHLQSQDKENLSDESNSYQENQVKRQLYESLKKQGILDGLKSQLRGKLYDQLKLKNDKVGVNFKELGNNRLTYKLGISVIADFLQKCDMPYAMSVFLPESGIQQEILSKKEVMEVLRVDRDEQFKERPGIEHTPLLMDLLDQLKANNGSLRGNAVSCSVQTEEAGEEGMNLDQKLRKVDYKYMEQADIQKCLPFKSLEERMVRYRKECEEKFQLDLETEIRRLKEFELSKIRMDEAQKYRTKLQEYRDELETLQQDKIRELKIRETEAWDRIKNREREVEKNAFEQRQRLEKEEEILKYKERDISKSILIEQNLAREERERLQKAERDLQKKIAELEAQRVRLEKEQAREIEAFKSDQQRKLKDEEFDLHRRKLGIEEAEHHIQLDKDRIAMMETRNRHLEKGSLEVETELKETKHQLEKISAEHRELQQQIKILNENLRRESEVGMSKEKENQTLWSENKSLKDMLHEVKTTNVSYKEDQNSLIENLRVQLNETREMITKMRENKEKEFKKLREKYEEDRRRESEQYQTEYDKLKHEIGLMQRRLGQEEHYNKELAVLNHKLQNNVGKLGVSGQYFYGQDGGEIGLTYSKHRMESHHHYYGGADVGAMSDESDDELAKRKKAQADLEREEAELKRNIKSLMRVAPESRVLDDPVMADRVRKEPRARREDNEAQPIKSRKEESKADSFKQDRLPPPQSEKRQWTAPSPRKDDLQKREVPPPQKQEPKKKESPKKESPKKEVPKSEPVKSGKKPEKEEIRFSSYDNKEEKKEDPQSQGSFQKKSGSSVFKGSSFNPLLKRASQEPVKTEMEKPSAFPSLHGQEKNSSFKKENDISEHIDEIYDDDNFESDVLDSRKVETKPMFSGNIGFDKKNSDSYSNDGFVEREEEDLF